MKGRTVNSLDQLCFIAAPCVVILAGLLLVLISQITKPDPYVPPNAPRHSVETSTAIEFNTEVYEGTIDTLESYVQVGRRGRYSAARSMPVAEDWRPYIGDLRVTILLERTAEYLFVRQPVQQLTDPYERAQWAT